MVARNYMQDITPLRNAPEKRTVPIRRPTADVEIVSEEAAPPPKSIRNIAPTPRTRPPVPPPPRRTPDSWQTSGEAPRRSGVGLWGAAIISLLVLAGAAVLVLYPSTVVTITPHTHVIPFDDTTQINAYPVEAAAPGMITYTVITESFEDSSVVAANGVEQATEKASGTIMVYNEYSDQPVRLIKNTRFESPSGLIFRIPESVDVPGKQGDVPGSISVTVFADQSGESYNLPPTDRFTIPGLKSSPDMHMKVYGRSVQAFSGGFVGERPAVAPATLDAARAEIRGRLTEKARSLAAISATDVIAFPGLAQIRFESLPPTQESGGGVRIYERATVRLPTFPKAAFSSALGQAVSASAEGQTIDIMFSDDFAAEPVEPSAPADLGTEPLQFVLTGRAKLVWQVNADELRSALAGREESAFQSIVQNFPSIDVAEARITPFWRTSFPSDVAAIRVDILPVPETF